MGVYLCYQRHPNCFVTILSSGIKVYENHTRFMQKITASIFNLQSMYIFNRKKVGHHRFLKVFVKRKILSVKKNSQSRVKTIVELFMLSIARRPNFFGKIFTHPCFRVPLEISLCIYHIFDINFGIIRMILQIFEGDLLVIFSNFNLHEKCCQDI